MYTKSRKNEDLRINNLGTSNYFFRYSTLTGIFVWIPFSVGWLIETPTLLSQLIDDFISGCHFFFIKFLHVPFVLDNIYIEPWFVRSSDFEIKRTDVLGFLFTWDTLQQLVTSCIKSNYTSHLYQN